MHYRGKPALQRFHRHYRGKPALPNQHYSATTALFSLYLTAFLASAASEASGRRATTMSSFRSRLLSTVSKASYFISQARIPWIAECGALQAKNMFLSLLAASAFSSVDEEHRGPTYMRSFRSAKRRIFVGIVAHNQHQQKKGDHKIKIRETQPHL